MARLSPWNLPRTSRATRIAIVLAVIAHAAGLYAFSRSRAHRTGEPPAIEGLGGEAAIGGMPASRERAYHTFRVLDDENGQAVEGVRVTDVVGGAVAYSSFSGRAIITARAAARLVVRFERPGYRTVETQINNTEREPAVQDVRLEHEDIPYARIDSIFARRCNYCHGTVGSVDAMDFTSYAKLQASRAHGRAVAMPFFPDSSALIRVLQSATDSDGRPSLHLRSTTSVTPDEGAVIAEWIRQGARNVKSP
jgi:hypothetical protein